MAEGLIRLYRSPLLEGEPLYTIGNIEQGVFEDGVQKGEKKPKLHSLFPVVEEDGRLCWSMLDTEGNRAYCDSMLPKVENPPIAYSVVYPGDEAAKAEPKVEAEEVKRRGPGRPRRDEQV